MKSQTRKFYGYSCHDCGNDLYLPDSPEKFIYCPFCGEIVNDLTYLSVLTVRIVKDEEYESDN